MLFFLADYIAVALLLVGVGTYLFKWLIYNTERISKKYFLSWQGYLAQKGQYTLSGLTFLNFALLKAVRKGNRIFKFFKNFPLCLAEMCFGITKR